MKSLTCVAPLFPPLIVHYTKVAAHKTHNTHTYTHKNLRSSGNSSSKSRKRRSSSSDGGPPRLQKKKKTKKKKKKTKNLYLPFFLCPFFGSFFFACPNVELRPNIRTPLLTLFCGPCPLPLPPPLQAACSRKWNTLPFHHFQDRLLNPFNPRTNSTVSEGPSSLFRDEWSTAGGET
ncbi:hypothetical protein IWX91DRAFT_152332 [Phyllosticta citricarpa]